MSKAGKELIDYVRGTGPGLDFLECEISERFYIELLRVSRWKDKGDAEMAETHCDGKRINHLG